MRTMRVQSRQGHDTLTWDPTDKAQVQVVRDKFDELIRQGFTAFTEPTEPGREPTLTRKFDPDVDLLFTVPFAGG